MRALILCAGLGTRLGKLTKDIPKPMIKVAGKPILEHLVDHLNKFGITEIIVNLHYKPEVIMNYFGTRLLYFYEPRLLGEEGTLKALRPWFGKDCFVCMNGDTLTDVNFQVLLEITKIEGMTQEFWDKEKEVYAGTRILHPDFYEAPICRKFYLDYYWQDIGTPEGLKKAREHYEKKSHHLS